MVKQENNNAFSFSLRIWFLTITLSLILVLVLGKRPNTPNLGDELSGFLYLNLVSFFLTIPILFIFYSLNIFLFNTIKNKFYLKLTINLFVAFCYINLFFFYYPDMKTLFFLLIPTALIWKIKIINQTKTYHDDIIDNKKDLDF